MKRLFVLSVLILAAGSVATATVIRVPEDQPTIQAGINATTDGDTVMVADGTYMGEGNKDLDFGGREIVVMSENGPEDCIINCQSSGRGIYFHYGETPAAVFKGFTITFGSGTYGGGINITNSSPTIERCIIYANNASYGGGMYISGDSSPLIINCTISQNTATNGGAVYSTGSDPVFNSCIVSGNSSSG